MRSSQTMYKYTEGDSSLEEWESTESKGSCPCLYKECSPRPPPPSFRRSWISNPAYVETIVTREYRWSRPCNPNNRAINFDSVICNTIVPLIAVVLLSTHYISYSFPHFKFIDSQPEIRATLYNTLELDGEKDGHDCGK